MADKNSTGAVHLTSIDLDISGVKNSLEEVKNSVEQTAEIVRNTKFTFGESSGTATGSDSSANNFGEKMQEQAEKADNAITITRNSIEKLIGQYLALEKSVESFRITEQKQGDTFDYIKTKIQESLQTLEQYAQSGDKIIEVTKEEKQAFDDIRDSLQEYKNQLSYVDNDLIKSGESFDKQSAKVANLAKSYSDFLSSLQKSGLESSAFSKLQENATASSNSIKQLYETIKSQGTITDEQAKSFSSLNRTLSDYKLTLSELKEVAQRTGEGLKKAVETPPDFSKYIKSIEQLNLQYKTFLNTLSKSKLSDKIGSPLSGIKGKAETAAKGISELNNAVKQSGNVTAEQAKKYESLSSELTTLKGELKDAETAAIKTGEGFKKGSFGVSYFLEKLGDKIKWMAEYQLIMLIQNAFSQIIDVIKDTEDSVVELQRVLNEDISGSAISKELYDIAYEFGQTFENVQEVAIRFAQTGKSWKETIDATRATMLGLNTAELEVSTATEGLIAVMAQFNIDAKDLESVIDRINITADNFPVTSEKIVAALQRAGGTASAFNMTLDETIATITALAEKTGRSGENIGTALNSLIIFTGKTENLKLFASLSDQMEELVNKYQAGSASIIEVWKGLNEEIANLSKQQQDALFNSTAFEEFASQFEAEAAEYAGTIQEIYGTAGAYRRNYLTVLLDDISTVDKVMENLAQSEGYSLQENEKYIATLTAQWNQLVIAAQELAVQFGQMGFLTIAKVFVEIATQALKLTNNLGGLRTVLISVATAFVFAKKQRIGEIFDNILTSVENLQNPLKLITQHQNAYNAALAAGKTEAEAFAIATGNMIGIIGVVASVISGVINIIKQYRQSLEDARQESIENGRQSAETANNIYSLYSAYLSAKEGYDGTAKASYELENASNALITALQEQGTAVKDLKDNYEDLEQQLKETTLESLEKELADQTIALENARESAQAYIDEMNFRRTMFFGAKQTTYEGSVQDGLLLGTVNFEKVDDLITEYKRLTEIKQEFIDMFGGEKAAYQDEYRQISYLLKQYEPYVSAILEAEAAQKNTSDQIKNITNGTVELTSATENLYNELENGNAILINLAEEMEALSEKFDEISGKVDSFQSAYSSLIDIIEEYNETGIMTADMLQTLLQMEPEYIEMLNVKAGSLELNQDAVNGLVSTNDAYLQQLVALKVAEEAEALATELQAAAQNNLTIAEIQSANATMLFSSELAKAILGEIQGTNTSNEFANALQNVANSASLSGDYLAYFTEQVQSMMNSYSSLLNLTKKDNIRTYYTPKTTSTKKSSGGGSKSSPEKDALNDEIKSWKKRKEAAQDYYDEIIDNLKKQKEESDDYYDGLIDRLKEVQENNDRINEQMDYYANRQKILTNLEQAQSRSGVEWRQKEMEYQQELADLDEEWRRKQEDWSVEDQIDELERLKKAADDLIDAQIEEMKLLKEAAVKEIEDVISKLQEKLSALTSSAASGVGGVVGGGLSEIEDGIDSLVETSVEGARTVARALKDELFDPMKKNINEIDESMQKAFNQNAGKYSNDAYRQYREGLLKPLKNDIDYIRNDIKNVFTNGAAQNAKIARDTYMNGFINPIKHEINELMKSAVSIERYRQMFTVNTPGTTSVSPSTTVNMYANISNPNTATAAMNELSSKIQGSNIRRK